MNREYFVIYRRRSYQGIRRYWCIEYTTNAKQIYKFAEKISLDILPLFCPGDVRLRHSWQQFARQFEERARIRHCWCSFEDHGQVQFLLEKNPSILSRKRFVFLRIYFPPSRCFSFTNRALVKPRISFLFLRPPVRRTSRSPGRRINVCW